MYRHGVHYAFSLKMKLSLVSYTHIIAPLLVDEVVGDNYKGIEKLAITNDRQDTIHRSA